MKKVALASLVCFVLIGCGGGGSGDSGEVDDSVVRGNETAISLSVTDINLTKEIKEEKLIIDSSDSLENQYLTVINHLRSLKIKCNDSSAKVGPSPEVTWNALLANAAKEHSTDYNSSGIYNRNHSGSGTTFDITATEKSLGRGSTPAERVKYNGYDGFSGENQATYVSYYETNRRPPNFSAINDDTWLSIMEGWMKSTSGHCSNIMNPIFEDFGMYEAGVNVENNGTHTLHSTYWTQEFGKPD